MDGIVGRGRPRAQSNVLFCILLSSTLLIHSFMDQERSGIRARRASCRVQGPERGVDLARRTRPVTSSPTHFTTITAGSSQVEPTQDKRRLHMTRAVCQSHYLSAPPTSDRGVKMLDQTLNQDQLIFVTFLPFRNRASLLNV